MAKPQKKVKVRTLSVGSVFAFTRLDAATTEDNKLELWKVVGRPTHSGIRTPEGKKDYVVLCVYVKKSKDDQNVQPDKYFNVNYEVIQVKAGGKDWAAIDQRDQPTDSQGKPAVSPISQLAKETGEALDPAFANGESDGSLESFIKDDEGEEDAPDED